MPSPSARGLQKLKIVPSLVMVREGDLLSGTGNSHIATLVEQTFAFHQSSVKVSSKDTATVVDAAHPAGS